MNKIEFGDCRDIMLKWATECVEVQTCITSPPYFGLRDYGVDGQIGVEPTPEEYVEALVDVFRYVRRILRDDGTLWLNLGDSYATNGRAPEGLKPKDLIGIPWRVAFALQADGWVLRQDIIWHKPNPMPESVKDRCTKAHEYIFLLSKREHYYFDSEAFREESVKGAAGSKFNKGKTAEHQLGRSSDSKRIDDGRRNRRSVWTIPTQPFGGAHFAAFPPSLVEPCVLAGSRAGDIVLDPFMGSGTTASVALLHGRKYIGCELNPEYVLLQEQRLEPRRHLFNT